jgi:hypothetical protein
VEIWVLAVRDNEHDSENDVGGCRGWGHAREGAREF